MEKKRFMRKMETRSETAKGDGPGGGEFWAQPEKDWAPKSGVTKSEVCNGLVWE